MLFLKHLITLSLFFSTNLTYSAEDGSKCKIGERATPDQTDFLANTFNLTLNEYPKCFEILAGEKFIEPSMDSTFLGKEITQMCQCEGPELDASQKEISKKKINDLYEKELAKSFKGKFYNVINQIVNVDTFIKNKNTNSSFLAKVPNCQFSYIFDELKKAREKEGCDKGSFDKRMELAFGTKDIEEAKKKLADEVSPIMQNKTKEGSCLPYKTYVRISSKEAFSYDTTYLYRDDLDRKTMKDNRLELGKAKRIHTRLSIHLANLQGEAPALDPISPDITLNDVLSAAEKTSKNGGTYVHTISKMIEAQKEKNPLLKAVLSNKESANKFVEIALSKLCSPDKVQPGEECSFKSWEDIVDSQEDIEDILLSDENLDSLGKSLNDQCNALAGFKHSQGRTDSEEGDSVSNSTELDFLCKVEIPKPSFETFKNGLLPALAKEAPTGDLVFHGMEYAKGEYCDYKPEKGYSIKPKTSRNKIESYFQPASREVSEIEKMYDTDRLEKSPYEKMDQLTCDIVNKNCKEANKADCFKNDKLSSILANINPDDYFDSEDPSTFGNNVFLGHLKEKVSELVAANEREPQTTSDPGGTVAGNLLGDAVNTGTTDELFAQETGANSTDSTVTSYLAHGTSDDRNIVIEHRRRIESGEIPANTPISIPRRGFDAPSSDGGIITDSGPVDTGTIIEDQVEQDIARDQSGNEITNDSNSNPISSVDNSPKPVIAVNNEVAKEPSKVARREIDIDDSPAVFDDNLSPVFNNSEVEPSETISYEDPNKAALEYLAELRKELDVEERKNIEILDEIERERIYQSARKEYDDAMKRAQRGSGFENMFTRAPASATGPINGGITSELNSKFANVQEFAENGYTKSGTVPYGYGGKASVSTSSKKRGRGPKVKGKGSYYSTSPLLSASEDEIEGFITANGLKLKKGPNFQSLKDYSKNIGRAYEFNSPEAWGFGRVIPHPIIQNRGLEDVIRQYGLEGKKFHSLHIDPMGVKDRKVILITFDFPKGYFDENQGTPEYDQKRKQIMGAIAYSRSEFSGKAVLKKIRNTTVEVSRIDLTGKKLPKEMKEIKLFAFKNLMLESETMNNAIMVDLINMSAFRVGMD